MDDPNVVYKRAFAALQEKLGRVPGVQDAEWLVIGNEYSRGWAPAEETVRPPNIGENKQWSNASTADNTSGKTQTKYGDMTTSKLGVGPTTTSTPSPESTRVMSISTPEVSVADPGDMSPSRQPAPQARTEGSEAGAREATLPLSGPGTNPTGAEAETVPAAGGGPGWNSQRATSGRRGPSGGILAQCVVCGQEWERGKVRGRPSVKCERCR